MNCNETHNEMERYMNENATALLHDLNRLYNTVRSTGIYFELVSCGNGRLILTNKKASKRSERFTLNEVLMRKRPHDVLLHEYLTDVTACGTKYGLNAHKTFVLPVFCAHHRCLHLFFENGLSSVNETGEWVHETDAARACHVHYAPAHFAQLWRIYGNRPLWRKMCEWVAAGILSPLTTADVSTHVSMSTPKRPREVCEQNTPAKRTCVEVIVEDAPTEHDGSPVNVQQDDSPMLVQDPAEESEHSPLVDVWPVHDAPAHSAVEPDVDYPVTMVAALLAGDDDYAFDASVAAYEEDETDVNMLCLSSDSGNSELMPATEESEIEIEIQGAAPTSVPLFYGEVAPLAAPSFYGEACGTAADRGYAYDCDANGMPYFPFDNDAFALDEEEMQRCLMQAGAFAHHTFCEDPFAELQYMQN